MKDRMTNHQFVVNAYMTAWVNRKVYQRNKKRAIFTPHGFVPNHIWNSGLTAGSDRRAREIRALYPTYFETIRRKEYMKIYEPNNKRKIISNWEMNRIKPSMIRAWIKITKEWMAK